MSKDYSYNKKKLKSRQGRAIYGLLGQQLGGMGAVVAGGTKGNILGRYAAGSLAGMGAGYLAGAHLPVGGNRQLDYTVERAIKHYRKTGKKNATFRDLEKNYDLKLSKQAALENFFLVKESSKHGMSRIERHAMNVDRAATKSLPRLHCHTVKLEELYDKPIPMKKKAALENFYMLKEAGVGVSAGPVSWTPSMGLLGTFVHPAPNKRDFNSYKEWKDMEREKGKSLRSRRYMDRALTGATIGSIGGMAVALGQGYGAAAPLAAIPALGIGGLAGLGYAMYEEEPKG